MYKRLPCYLRTQRKQWALTQSELARLLGLKSAQHVSRLERGRRQPSVSVLLAVEIIFGEHPRDLFPKLFDAIEERTVRFLYGMQQRLAGEDKRASERRRQFAAEALRRAAESANPHYDYQP